MSVSVKEVVELEIFRKAKILTSPLTLNSSVTQVAVTDNPVTETDKAISKEGAFYLSSLFFAIDEPKAIREHVDYLLEFGAAALCVIDEYVPNIPPEIINYCNEHGLALIQISSRTRYSDIITQIMQLVFFDQQEAIVESKLDALIEGYLDTFYRNRLIHEINSHFQNNLTVVFCKPDSSDTKRRTEVINRINSELVNIAMNYRDGIIAFLSYGDIGEKDVQRKIDYCTGSIQGAFPHAIIGVSDNFHPLLEAKTAANQAMNAVKYNTLEAYGVINYSDLGFARLLIMLNGQTELSEYCHDILDSVLNYDRDGEGVLFETLQCFFKNNRNHKETASEMHVHENTIRHRIDRAVQLTEKGFSGKYALEELFIACRIYRFLHKKPIN
ncbi:MAG: PucR family transcriptional regulator ligand-binding domain-containing protein [Clostridiales Family XIII bacterium]|nr:PucR family transcriptional regulator ligand-binding domain-containing protein [Clostridiales Family XIII bacterium]